MFTPIIGPFQYAGWRLDRLAYDSKELDIGSNPAINPSPRGVGFNADGTMFVVYDAATSGGSFYEYDLSTPWDISTATYSGTPATAISTVSRGCRFKPDGTMLYGCTDSTRINAFALSTPFDITSRGSAISGSSFGSLSPGTNPGGGPHFSPDGVNFYLISYSTTVKPTLWQFSYATPWDIASAVTVEGSITLSELTQPNNTQVRYAVYMRHDGRFAYVLSGFEDVIYEYKLAVAFDITTAVYTGVSQSLLSEGSSPFVIDFKPDGSKMYIVDSQDDVVSQYSVS